MGSKFVGEGHTAAVGSRRVSSPPYAFLVHVPPEIFGNMDALRRVLLHSGTCRTPYVFCVEVVTITAFYNGTRTWQHPHSL